VRAHLTGTVQGVGFRPHVFRLATALGLGGSVRNDGRGVRVDVEGSAAAVGRFLTRVVAEAPPLAVIETVRLDDLAPAGVQAFEIAGSLTPRRSLPAIPPDMATCAACLAELFDPNDRRFRYPFITCTDCGPRFTITEAVPYDRRRTTMAGFAMCARCRAEYEDPGSRRFHAETNACPACGPQARFTDASGRACDGGVDAIAQAAAALLAGAIVAVKGIGGFHLACRADDDRAVRRLRAGKARDAKPFALMVSDPATARRLVELDATEEQLLASRQRPIVLARRHAGAMVATDVAPGVPTLGVMLPYAPLHHLLLADAAVPLVMTSGNRAGEPIAREDGDALARLSGVADRFLLHDRPIAARADDSVARVMTVSGERRPILVRRARGFAPLPIRLLQPATQPVLALGAEQKSVCGLARGWRAWLTPHLGDLDCDLGYREFVRAVERLQRLLGVRAAAVVHDLHPGYRSTQYAHADGMPARIGVQHHHAHVASCLADNGLVGPAIGVAWDGTGYGADGTIWGGEFLVADLDVYARVGHLQAIALPGGDAAIREPWRMAASLLHAAYGSAASNLDLAVVRRRDPAAWRVLLAAVERGLNAPATTSAGRLFDGIAALCGLGDVARYEAEAAIALEGAAEPVADHVYPVGIDDASGRVVVHTTDLVHGVVGDLHAGVPVTVIAARFHATMATTIAEVAVRIRATTGLGDVALSGGVFQNAWLVPAASAPRAARGFTVHVHRQVPPNDGGLALGQLAVGVRRLAREHS
jgi:hydrogenase maturation protein HypF